MARNEIVIDGVIGEDIDAAIIKSQLEVADRTQPLTVRIHSEGGSVFEGFAIYDAFKAYDGPKRCRIESSAFSIASFIPMAFDEIEITPNGYMMLHNPYVEAEGDDEELANKATLLANLKGQMIRAYAERSGKPEEEIQAILKRETYLSAEQAQASGFVDKIAIAPVVGRVFAKVNTMPHGVVAALFGAGSSGEASDPTKEIPMSESQPVAATLQEIETAFPKAKSDFIVRCLKKGLPMAGVAQAAVEEMMAENTELMAKVSSLEEELAKCKAEMGTTETTAPEGMEVEVEEEEEPTPAPSARRKGLAPIAVARTSGRPTARQQWNELLTAKVSSGMPRAKAIRAIDAESPGLREQMVREVNMN